MDMDVELLLRQREREIIRLNTKVKRLQRFHDIVWLILACVGGFALWLLINMIEGPRIP